jgi:hypothetical protein
MGIFGLGIAAWSIGLRDVAVHLVDVWWLKCALWFALFLVSGFLWWYPLHRWWRIERSHRRYDEYDLDSTLLL